MFVRPAVKLIPANTPDIVNFFKRFRPAWVEWLGGTFIVELEDASCVESLFKELTVKVREPAAVLVTLSNTHARSLEKHKHPSDEWCPVHPDRVALFIAQVPLQLSTADPATGSEDVRFRFLHHRRRRRRRELYSVWNSRAVLPSRVCVCVCAGSPYLLTLWFRSNVDAVVLRCAVPACVVPGVHSRQTGLAPVP